MSLISGGLFMHNGGRTIALILAVLLLCSLVGAAMAATPYAVGCLYIDANGNKAVDSNEPCQSGWTLHAIVKDNTGAVVKEEDFVTNQLGAAQAGSNPPSNKYAYALPTPGTGQTWKVTISEIPPPGYTVDVPAGTPSYVDKTYTSTTNVTGLAFGNLPMVYTAEGCKWVDDNPTNGVQDTAETCQAGWTLHVKVWNLSPFNPNIIKDENFVTNTAGTGGKFSYVLPPVPYGAIYNVTISEAQPAGYVIIYPAGADKSYTLSYRQTQATPLSGFNFGNQPVSYTAEGCFWVDANGDNQQATDGTEPCLAGKTLHARVTDGSNTIKEEDFTTNTAGSGSFPTPCPGSPREPPIMSPSLRSHPAGTWLLPPPDQGIR
jgi:hypothetical protein